MKLIFLLSALVCFNLAYAGTPGINETYVIYGFVLILIGLIIGTSYLIKFIKRKFSEEELKNHETTAIDDSSKIEI